MKFKMVQTTANNPTVSTTITMKAISSDSKAQIISLLSSGLSVRQTATQTHHSIVCISKILSEHFPDSRRATGGHPKTITPTDTRHIVHLLSSGWAENAVQVSRELRDIPNTPVSPQTVSWDLKQAG